MMQTIENRPRAAGTTVGAIAARLTPIGGGGGGGGGGGSPRGAARGGGGGGGGRSVDSTRA